MICGRKEQFIPLKMTCFRAQSFSIRKTRINKTRLPSCLCPKLNYTDDKTHTVIKVIENTRTCPLYRSTEGVTCTFRSHPVECKEKNPALFLPIFSSPQPLGYGELLWLLDACRPSSVVCPALTVVNNFFKGHLLNYCLDFDQTW